MYRCQHIPCILEHTTKDVSALIVENVSQGRGFYKDMFAPIQVNYTISFTSDLYSNFITYNSPYILRNYRTRTIIFEVLIFFTRSELKHLLGDQLE